jgi:tetratricopeptide (TPR) repeat protein
LLKAAVQGQFKTTAKWIADLLFLANKASKKPSFNLYILLKESYTKVGFFERAITALHQAVLLKPKDSVLADEFKRLEAEKTVATGKYETASNFRESIKNRSQQEMLQAQESVVKTVDYKTSSLQRARKLYAENPNLSKNVHKLADSLAQMETDDAETEAIELLQDNYENTRDFSYIEKAGRINIQRAKRHLRAAKKNLDLKPEDPDSANQLKNSQRQLNQIELEHYKKCVENYPTDSRYKYELGSRLLNNGLFDKALPLLQEAKNDPRLKFTSLNKIGLCFYHKKWFPDAIDIFTQVIEKYELSDDVLAKELRYNLAVAYEDNKDAEKALEIFRKIAQQDFNYKDVKERVDKLRKI